MGSNTMTPCSSSLAGSRMSFVIASSLCASESTGDCLSPCSPLCGLVASLHCASPTAASARSSLATCSAAWLHAPWPSTTPLPCKRHACPSNSASALALALKRYSSCSKSPPSATHAPLCFLLTPSRLSITSPGRPCSRRCVHGPSLSPCCLLPASFMARPAAMSGQTMPEPTMRCSRLRAGSKATHSCRHFMRSPSMPRWLMSQRPSCRVRPCLLSWTTRISCARPSESPLFMAPSATPCGLAPESNSTRARPAFGTLRERSQSLRHPAPTGRRCLGRGVELAAGTPGTGRSWRHPRIHSFRATAPAGEAPPAQHPAAAHPGPHRLAVGLAPPAVLRLASRQLPPPYAPAGLHHRVRSRA